MGQLFGLVKLSTWRERLDMHLVAPPSERNRTIFPCPRCHPPVSGAVRESLAGQSFHMRGLVLSLKLQEAFNKTK